MNNDPVTAVILAAGEGKRLRPLTNRRPKPMVPVANRPLLDHIVEAVAGASIDRIVLVVGYRQERIRNYFGDGDEWGVTIEYVEQSTQLGTGHAVLQAEPIVDSRFLVLNGDRIVGSEVVAAVSDRIRENSPPVMTITTADRPRDYGVVSLNRDRVTAIDEKPDGPVGTNIINAGVYGFSVEIFDAISKTHSTGELEITATLDELARDDGVTAVRYDGQWLDVSNLWDLLRVNAGLISDAQPTGSADQTLSVSASAAEDVVVAGNVRTGPNVTVGGSTAIGSNATVGANAIVENAVIFPDAVVGAGAVVQDAVIGGNAQVGPNVTIEGGHSSIVVDDTVHDDVELGAVIGDNARIGGGVTLTNGAVVGDDVRADAGVVIDGRVESGAVVRRG